MAVNTIDKLQFLSFIVLIYMLDFYFAIGFCKIVVIYHLMSCPRPVKVQYQRPGV